MGPAAWTWVSNSDASRSSCWQSGVHHRSFQTNRGGEPTRLTEEVTPKHVLVVGTAAVA